MKRIRLDDDVAHCLMLDARQYLQDKPIQGFEMMSFTLWNIARQIEVQEMAPRPWWQRIFG